MLFWVLVGDRGRRPRHGRAPHGLHRPPPARLSRESRAGSAAAAVPRPRVGRHARPASALAPRQITKEASGVRHLYPVKPHVAARAHINTMEEYQRLYRLSLDNPEWFWAEQAQGAHLVPPVAERLRRRLRRGRLRLVLRRPAQRLLQLRRPPPRRRSATAPRSSGPQDEPGVYRHITYRELKHNVCRIANVLLAHGVKQGDRVCIYMPMIPELVVHDARLRAHRRGALGGVRRLQRRVAARPHRRRALPVVITANEGLRGGKRIPLKTIVDRAIEGMSTGRDRARGAPHRRRGADAARARPLARRGVPASSARPAPSSGWAPRTRSSSSTPRAAPASPRACCTRPAATSSTPRYTHKLVFDYHPGDVYFCAADVGWITGHSYIVYGPLANGATTVMFESTPTYPDAGPLLAHGRRPRRQHLLHRADGAARDRAGRRRVGEALPPRLAAHPRARVGEPINPEIWRWYHDVVGEGRCAVVDTWWQTETGGILITPLPGVTPTKPGSATLPFFGVKPVVVDTDDGKVLEGNGVSGALCLGDAVARPGAHRVGRSPALQGDLLHAVPGLLLHRRRLPARRGRLLLDHRPHRRRAQRLGPPPGHGRGRERAGGARGGGRGRGRRASRTPIKGQGIYAYVLARRRATPAADREQLQGALKEQVRHVIGAFAAPDVIHVASGLPKTRSGKIMRRILRKIAACEYDGLGDITTLAEPEVVERLIEEHKTGSVRGGRGLGRRPSGPSSGPPTGLIGPQVPRACARSGAQSAAAVEPSSVRVRRSVSRSSWPWTSARKAADLVAPRRARGGPRGTPCAACRGDAGWSRARPAGARRGARAPGRSSICSKRCPRSSSSKCARSGPRRASRRAATTSGPLPARGTGARRRPPPARATRAASGAHRRRCGRPGVRRAVGS